MDEKHLEIVYLCFFFVWYCYRRQRLNKFLIVIHFLIVIIWSQFKNGSSYEIPYEVSIIVRLPSTFCYSLQSIIIPGTVECIIKYSFDIDYKFSITYYGESDPKFDESSFVNYHDNIEILE